MREQEQYKAFLRGIGEGVIATDHEGKVVIVNPTAQEMLGYKDTDLVGKELAATVLIEDEKGNRVPDDEHPVHLALSLGTKLTTFNSFIRKNKTKFPVALTANVVRLDGKLLGAILIFRDITKEKDSGFVSLASHQLRTPLATVNWYAEMLLAGDAGKVTAEQKKYLEEIYQGNQRMVELVNALLNVSRIEFGTFAIQPKPTDIRLLLRSVIDEQQPQISERKINLVSEFKSETPKMNADPNLLRMVFQNLLSNAVKYTPVGGAVNVAIARDSQNKKIVIKFSDTGWGIPKNQQNRMFTRFFRADNIRSKDTVGTGLGLYIVKAVLDQSGGDIRFESEENKGTTFYVTLPLRGMKRKEGTKVLE